MVPPQPSQVTFDVPHDEETQQQNRKSLLHSQSSPNLTEYVIEESDEEHEEDDFEAVTATHDDSSSFSLVSGPPSVNSIWSSRISFKDALMQKSNVEPKKTPEEPPTHHHSQRIRKVKPKFVVAQVIPIKHAKS